MKGYVDDEYFSAKKHKIDIMTNLSQDHQFSISRLYRAYSRRQ